MAPKTNRKPGQRTHPTQGRTRQTAGQAGREGKRTPERGDPEVRERAPEQLSATLNRLLSQQWVQSLVLAPLASLVLILVGLRDPPKRVPLAEFVRDHPLPSLILAVGGLLVATAAVGLRGLFARPNRTIHNTKQVSGWLTRVLAVTTTLAAFSTSGMVMLTSIVLARPTWCPEVLCPQPPGPHDANLEAGFTAIQSSDYFLAADPATYSLAQLPASGTVEAVPAAPVEGAAIPGATPYRLVLRIHNLRRGGVGLVLEAVTLHIVRQQSVPDPLRVWDRGQPLVYQVNPYDAVYTGEPPGGQVTAEYSGTVRVGRVQLAPGESDELSIGVHASQPASLTFQVWLTYRIASEDSLRTLKLPYMLTVIFSDPLNWHAYQLSGGRLVPT